MSSDSTWDVNKYRDENETDDQWELRKAFIEKYRNSYAEDRLVCLSKVFINIQFLGCKYPKELMEEVSRLTHEIVKSYREQKKNKFRRAFASASSSSQDRVTATKRSNMEAPKSSKTSKIQFVRASTEWVPENKPTPPTETITKPTDTTKPRTISETYIPKRSKEEKDSEGESDTNKAPKEEKQKQDGKAERITKKADPIDFVKDLEEMACLEINKFNEMMFYTEYGKLVFLIRPWADFVWNMQATCQSFRIPAVMKFENDSYVVRMNHILVARFEHKCKNIGRTHLARKAWDILRQKVICLLIKEKYVDDEKWRVNTSDVCQRTSTEQGLDRPVQNDVAIKMMQMMGWTGGGLGSNSQGIEEPIKPNIHVVNRAGLGSNINDERNLKRSAFKLMRDYRSSDTVGVDLVFSSDFSKEERSVIHHCAKKSGLSSRSYGDRERERFLVVRRKQDWFSIVKHLISQGGSNKKYQVFIPAGILDREGSNLPQSVLDIPSTSSRPPMVTSTVTSNFLDSSDDSSDDS